MTRHMFPPPPLPPEPSSDPWSGQTMSVQDYNAAVSELEQTPRGAPSSTPQDGRPSPTFDEVFGGPEAAGPPAPTFDQLFPPGWTPDNPVNSVSSPQIVKQAHQRVADPYLRSEPTLNVPLSTPSPPQCPRPSQPQPDPVEAPPPYSPSSQPQPAFVPEQLGSERAFLAGDHDANSVDLIAMFEANPLSLIHTRDPNNPISFAFAPDCTMRWLVDALDIEILAPAYLPTGSATVIIDYTAAAMGALLQSSDIVDGDIMTSCYRFSEDPVGWFRESQAMEFVQPEWGTEWERYWVWGILYREGDVKVRVKRKVDVEEVRAWLGGSRVWTEG